MLPLEIALTEKDEAMLDLIAQEVGEQMWRALGLSAPPSKRPAPTTPDTTTPDGVELEAQEALDRADEEETP